MYACMYRYIHICVCAVQYDANVEYHEIPSCIFITTPYRKCNIFPYVDCVVPILAYTIIVFIIIVIGRNVNKGGCLRELVSPNEIT